MTMRDLVWSARRLLCGAVLTIMRLRALLGGARPVPEATPAGPRLTTPVDRPVLWLLVRSRSGQPVDLTLRIVRAGSERDGEPCQPLGRGHLASLRLTGGKADAPGPRDILDLRLQPADAQVECLVLPDGWLNRLLVANLLRLTRRLALPLFISRDLVVDASGGALPALREGDWFPRDPDRHLAHVVDLAALAEARLPLLSAAASGPAMPASPPLISLVVPVFDTPVAFLDELMASFRQQETGLAELVLSDDASSAPATRDWLARQSGQPDVVVIRSNRNGGIGAATNAGIERARGRWIGLIDHDDALTPFALARIARALAERPDCQFLYTDEIICDRHLRTVGVFHKPAFDLVLLSGVNYINHLSLYRRDRLIDIGLLSIDCDGSQDYDLVLRYTRDLPETDLVHLPYPAYLWRRDAGAYSIRHLDRATANARRALAARFAIDGRVPRVDGTLAQNLHRVRFDLLRTDWPSVSVIIPSIDSPALIGRVLEALTARTDYPDLEIIVIDNGTSDPRTLAIYQDYRARHPRFRARVEKAPFNFSAAINKGIRHAGGDVLLLLNNDIDVIEPGWLKEMVSLFDYGGVGIVGAKLLYPDLKLQHAGVIVGYGKLAGHWFIGEPETHPGPMGRLRVRQSFSAVTGACMAVSRACIEAVGGFDEDAFAIAYNDVDYCLRARAAGFRVVWTPFATLVHDESATRGSDETPANIERFRREQQNLQRRHATDRFFDPAANPWQSRSNANPFLVGRHELPAGRTWMDAADMAAKPTSAGDGPECSDTNA